LNTIKNKLVLYLPLFAVYHSISISKTLDQQHKNLANTVDETLPTDE
jgi:phage regulator Rha-like protein